MTEAERRAWAKLERESVQAKKNLGPARYAIWRRAREQGIRGSYTAVHSKTGAATAVTVSTAAVEAQQARIDREKAAAAEAARRAAWLKAERDAEATVRALWQSQPNHPMRYQRPRPSETWQSLLARYRATTAWREGEQEAPQARVRKPTAQTAPKALPGAPTPGNPPQRPFQTASKPSGRPIIRKSRERLVAGSTSPPQRVTSQPLAPQTSPAPAAASKTGAGEQQWMWLLWILYYLLGGRR